MLNSSGNNRSFRQVNSRGRMQRLADFRGRIILPGIAQPLTQVLHTRPRRPEAPHNQIFAQNSRQMHESQSPDQKTVCAGH